VRFKQIQSTMTSVFLLAVMQIFACGKESGGGGNPGQDADVNGIQFSAETARGVIQGTPWVFAGGHARPSHSAPETAVSIYLISDEKNDPCDPFSRTAADGLYVSFTVQAKLGATEFTVRNGVSLGSGSNTGHTSVQIARGGAVIDEISDERITGRIFSRFNAETEINGRFDIARCPEGFAP